MLSQDQDQRSEQEAESQVRSTSDDVLHAVSIPAYDTHRCAGKKTVVLLKQETHYERPARRGTSRHGTALMVLMESN